MSTDSTPGFNPANFDQLQPSNWAEHEDGSLILVEGVENRKVIFCIFDTTKSPVIEYRTAIEEDEFKKKFSYKANPGGQSDIRWIWHDKSPDKFPWEKVIDLGAHEGERIADTAAELAISDAKRATRERIINPPAKKTAAETVADKLKKDGQEIVKEELKEDHPRRSRKIKRLANQIVEMLTSAGLKP